MLRIAATDQSHRYSSIEIGCAGLVLRRNHEGAALDTQNTLGTRDEIAISNASPPFSMEQHSSITAMDGCSPGNLKDFQCFQTDPGLFSAAAS